MEPQDSFIMRTGRPETVRYIQQLDITLSDTVPLELRRSLSEMIWNNSDYEYLWLSETSVAEIDLPEDEFKQTATELSQEVIETKKDGRVLLYDGKHVFAHTRTGNIEGEKRNGSIYKSILLLDYEEFNPVLLTGQTTPSYS